MSCKNTLCDSAVSSPLSMVGRGNVFLPGVSVSDIESMQTKNTGYKIKCILQAVKLRKEGRTYQIHIKIDPSQVHHTNDVDVNRAERY